MLSTFTPRLAPVNGTLALLTIHVDADKVADVLPGGYSLETRRKLLDGYPGRASLGITSDPADGNRCALVVPVLNSSDCVTTEALR